VLGFVEPLSVTSKSPVFDRTIPSGPWSPAEYGSAHCDLAAGAIDSMAAATVSIRAALSLRLRCGLI